MRVRYIINKYTGIIDTKYTIQSNVAFAAIKEDHSCTRILCISGGEAVEFAMIGDVCTGRLQDHAHKCLAQVFVQVVIYASVQVLVIVILFIDILKEE